MRIFIKSIDQEYDDLQKGKVYDPGAVQKGYIGFKKLEGTLKKKGAENPGGLARYIGEKKYGKKKFQEATKKGKKMKGVKSAK